jgi:hypothetical protein
VSQKRKRTLIVSDCKERHSGHGAKGDYTIYTVWATTPEGEVVTEELRAFKPLNDLIGRPVEFEVDRHDHPQYGTSFTLHPPKVKTSERLDRVEKDLAAALARIEQLESRLEAEGRRENAGSSSGTHDTGR